MRLDGIGSKLHNQYLEPKMDSSGYGAMEIRNSYPDKIVSAPSLKQRLEMEVQQCEIRLAEAKRAREILNSHPELEELINILNKGRI